MQTVKEFDAVVATVDRSTDFARLLSDPTQLINCRSGDLFDRVDGAKWEWPAYRVFVEIRDDGSVKKTFEPWTCIEDATVYSAAGSGERVRHKGKAA